MTSTFVLCISTFVIGCVLCIADGKVIGAYVLPHGGLALDPKNFNTTNSTEILEAHELHNACQKVGQAVRSAQPDVIFLSTPHGLADYRNFIIYSNAEAAGL